MYSKIIHLKNGGRHFGGRKLCTAWGKTTTIIGLINHLPTSKYTDQTPGSQPVVKLMFDIHLVLF